MHIAAQYMENEAFCIINRMGKIQIKPKESKNVDKILTK